MKLALLTLIISVFANSVFGGTFGYTSPGATRYTINVDKKQGSKFDLLEAADIEGILFWGKTGGGAPKPTVVKCAIYRDNAGLPDTWISPPVKSQWIEIALQVQQISVGLLWNSILTHFQFS